MDFLCKKFKDATIILFLVLGHCLLFALHFVKKASAPLSRLIFGFQHEWILKSPSNPAAFPMHFIPKEGEVEDPSPMCQVSLSFPRWKR